jgi:hypothetical protein
LRGGSVGRGGSSGCRRRTELTGVPSTSVQDRGEGGVLRIESRGILFNRSLTLFKVTAHMRVLGAKPDADL